MLLVPLLTDSGDPPTLATYAALAAKSLIFVVTVMATRYTVGRWLVPMLSGLRSVELVVLFAVCLLGSVCWVAYQLGLPSAVGALAAGIILGGNRLSQQVDTIVLPFRESFAAVFFVTVGTLLDPRLLLHEPWLLLGGMIGMVALKAAAAAVALKLVGLGWKAAIGMGLGFGTARRDSHFPYCFPRRSPRGSSAWSTTTAGNSIALGTLIPHTAAAQVGLAMDRLATRRSRRPGRGRCARPLAPPRHRDGHRDDRAADRIAVGDHGGRRVPARFEPDQPALFLRNWGFRLSPATRGTPRVLHRAPG